MTRLVGAYFTLLKVLMALCLAGMVVLVFGNVVLRYGFNSGITVSEELSRLFFVWMCFLGATLALHERAHLGFDALVVRLPRAGKTVCAALSYGIMLYITWLVLQGSWAQTLINLGTQAPATGLSMGWLYGSGVVFGLSTGVILLVELYRVLTGRATDADLVMVAESEDLPEDAAHDGHTGGHRSLSAHAANPHIASPHTARR
ncbi:TRAP transporter small permease [Azospirillum sp. TSO35-2]|uniref:TRAP transporter small permease n=1 Tax=Azospirillum sp. TSO35-2 TaxID=716796 RepID=UPI000D64F506|nr:TRAP transporter small permease [Azospirillum sp. TSO35-2]